ncbi:response regulator [Synoicihabitans lomoniglobus]|uniref:histidine kinase n=1 Tax=Synoicihabitans lomoniglobus TaxID=2909285 RepID=A0AAF0CSJ6_9BACT|nr:response regulator [Opitutaceae bacterium LMO-M01]WED67236.1 response regulator [Opitutaceae bacterium LMO-M01]
MNAADPSLGSSAPARLRRLVLGSALVLPGLCIFAVVVAMLMWTLSRGGGEWRDAEPDLTFLIDDPAAPFDGTAVVAGELDARFQPLSEFGGRLHGRAHGEYWLRIRLRPEDRGPDGSLLIQFNEGRNIWTLRELTLHDAEGTVVARTGYEVPLAERSGRGSGFTLLVPSNVAAVDAVYLHAHTHQKFFPSFFLWGDDAAAVLTNTRLDGLYFINSGVIITLILVHCVVFAGLRRRYQFYFLLFLVATQVHASMLHYAQSGWWPWLSEDGFFESAVAAVSLAYLALIWFSRHFLELPERMPMMDRLLKATAVLHVLILLVARITHDGFGWNAFAAFWIGKNVLTNVLLIVAAFLAWRRGVRHARLFLPAVGVFILFNAYQQGVRFGVVPGAPFPIAALDFSHLFAEVQAFLLSFAIADQVAGIVRARDAARQESIRHLESRRELEARATENLEREVAVKTRDLQSEVERTQRAEMAAAEALATADRASRAKSAFLASMSHELRTPLNAIMGYAQILERASDSDEQTRRAATTIRRSGDHLLALINDILDMSRIEAGKIEITTGEFGPAGVMNQVVDMMGLKAREKGLRLEVEIGDELHRPVTGDERHWRQVLVNVVGNAVKFTDQGFVRVAAGRSTDDDAWVRVRIEDTGPGVPDALKEAIFEPFRHVSPGERVHEGTGLGLAISRKLTGLMGGRLSVADRVGGGSVFQVELPLPEAGGSAVTDAPLSLPTGYEGERRRVLVVDDHRDNREMVAQMLTALGFLVDQAEDGGEALRKLGAEPFDLVIIDLVMPVMDGFEAVRRIRQEAAWNHLKIVASSASVFEEDRSQSIAAGCHDFLPKPIRESALVAVLERQLDLVWIRADAPDTGSIAPRLAARYASAPWDGLRLAAVRGEIARIRSEWTALRKALPASDALVREMDAAIDGFDPDRVVALIDQAVPALSSSSSHEC